MKKINTQEIPVKSTFVSLWMTVAMVLAFTGCSEEDLMQPANGQSGSLHITSVSVDGQKVGGRSRVAYEGSDTPVSINDLPANHSITGFSAGDEIDLWYIFNDNDDWGSATASYNGSSWTITDYGYYDGDDVINPNFTNNEKWADITMEAIVEPASEAPRSLGRQARSTSDYVLGNINIANVKLITDCLYASTEDGSITVDTVLNSPTLGATTIEFKHQDALLRLAIPESGFNVAGTYVVDGTAYNVTGLATLWAFLDGNYFDYYVPFTQVGNNLQAIVYDTYYTLAGFKAVLYATEVAAENTPMPSSTESEPSTITLDLPFKVDGSASTGIELEENKQYPLTLTLSPNQAVVNLASATGKPGWNVSEEDEEVLTGDNYLTYNAADQYFEVNAPVGLQLLNNWMSGGITTTELKAYNFVGCSSIPTNAAALSANVRLMQNIELTAPEEGASNWTAIGTESSPYTGTFDGNGHTITGMVINTTARGQGFVGYLGEGGQIKNLTFAGAQVASTEGLNVGIVAGVNKGMVDNCHTVGTSSVKAKMYVGGIVGRNENVITNCTNVAQVAAILEGVGGITGDNYGGFVSSCINSGSVIGTWLVGGIAGSQFEAEMIACGNTGLVSGDKQVGGIVGDNSGTVAGSWTIDIEEKDYDGEDTDTEDGVGYDHNDGINIIECYSVASNSALNSKLDKMNEALWQYYKDNSASTGLFWKETTDNWPTTVQQEVSGDSNPYMPDLKFIAPTGNNNPGGTFEVGNAKGLMILNEWMTSNLDNNENFKAIGFDGSGDIKSITSRMGVDVKLVKDITLPEVGEGESNWKPIKSNNGGYTKTFDGQGHTIRNLTINQPSADKIGLVGQLEAGSVKNLTLVNVKIKGNSYVGGIVGRMENSSTVENCSVSGEITSKGVTGGIVASNYGVITGCINHAAINVNFTGDYTCPVGGIVGNLSSSANCVSCGNTGVITLDGRTYYICVGGIVGLSDNAKLIGCWSIDNVEKEGYKNNYAEGANKDGFGAYYDSTITGCYTAAARTEGTTEQKYINDKVDDMNTALSSYGWQWEADDTYSGWPTPKKQ